ncbi:hypothetical protein [Proteiniphilum acetatigenes]|uniref:hypothetical protein n=1 Tax=Proteiniphilum acetatigenes TaxID=294710 RepID=UPI00039BB8A2|nr:hypothetical protein [Proteiniphilum acetatigenes]SFK63502.1 hypothetical protein SAMN05216357_10424 [Porphyromonadaceae bacterium KH3CP3RA]
MKRIFILLLLFSFTIVSVFAQSAEIKAIMEKARSGKQLSDDEMRKLRQNGKRPDGGLWDTFGTGRGIK